MLTLFRIVERGSFKNKGSLGIAIEGDARLGNWYEVIELNPQKHRTSKLAAAKTFADWLLSSEGQDAIADASGALNNLLQALEAECH